MGTIGDRAVVLGAGMAGLLAARVLARRYGEVVVVDRDRLPTEPADRRGIAQGHHSHALLARGQGELESQLPGITDELIADGAQAGDFLGRTRMYFGGRRICQGPSDMVALSCTRAFVEHHVRSRVVEAGVDISFEEQCDATGFTFGGNGHRVTGVRVAPRDSDGAERNIDADLVVDATGRQSHSGSWLAAAGFPEPPEERVVMDLAYGSRRYRLDSDALGGDLAILVAPFPENPRAGVLALTENGTAMLTMAGILGDRPPMDPEGFVAFAATLAASDIHEVIADAEPISEPVPYRFNASRWRHYERLRDLPDCLVVVGDALCSFNPVYGQGMTIAALEAEALGQHLDRHGSIRPRDLYRRLARIIRDPWTIAAGADLGFSGVEGRRTRSQALLGRYVNRLQRAAVDDPVLSRAFLGVTGLVDPPPTLMRPRIAMRVLRHR